MKKILLTATVGLVLMSCANEAMDGDASTDTTTFNQVPNDASANPLGDTTIDLNENGTYTNPNVRTDVDSSGKGYVPDSKGYKPGSSQPGNNNSGGNGSGGNGTGGNKPGSGTQQ